MTGRSGVGLGAMKGQSGGGWGDYDRPDWGECGGL